MKHAREDYNRIQDPAGLIGDDEPVFLLRAKDRTAPKTLRHWALLQRKFVDCDEHAVTLALDHADAMENWQAEYGCKTADVPKDPASERSEG